MRRATCPDLKCLKFRLVLEIQGLHFLSYGQWAIPGNKERALLVKAREVVYIESLVEKNDGSLEATFLRTRELSGGEDRGGGRRLFRVDLPRSSRRSNTPSGLTVSGSC